MGDGESTGYSTFLVLDLLVPLLNVLQDPASTETLSNLQSSSDGLRDRFDVLFVDLGDVFLNRASGKASFVRLRGRVDDISEGVTFSERNDRPLTTRRHEEPRPGLLGLCAESISSVALVFTFNVDRGVVMSLRGLVKRG